MRSPRLFTAAAPVLVLLTLAACATVPASPPVATIQELMDTLVDPFADALWDAVSTEVTAAGVDEREPRNDAEWSAVRRHALGLAEAARLLAEPGRRVAAGGRALEDSHVAGILTAPAIEQKIAADPARFAARAQALQAAAEQALAAIDARDVQRLLHAGERLDAACEQCHQIYWYPGDKRPQAALQPQARP